MRTIATMAMEAKQVVILDVRRSAVPVAQLEGHDMHINALDWAPHSSHLCTAGMFFLEAHRSGFKKRIAFVPSSLI